MESVTSSATTNPLCGVARYVVGLGGGSTLHDMVGEGGLVYLVLVLYYVF
jgi:hypothetical protein